MFHDSTSSESIFPFLLVVEAFSMQKVVEMLEEVVVGLVRGRVNMADEAKLCSTICSTFEGLVVWYAVGRCHGELGPFCWLVLAAGIAVFSASHQFAERTLRCNGFSGIQEAVKDQTGSRSPNSDHDLFWCKYVFGAFYWPSHWAGCHQLPYKTTFCHTSQSWSRNGSLLPTVRRWHLRTMIILIFGQFLRHSLIKLFQLSNLLQMQNDHRMVDVEFFSNFSHSCKRINFDDCSQLVIVNFQWLATLLLFKVLVSFAKLLKPSLYCMFVSSSWDNVLMMLWVVSVALQPILNLEKNNCSNLLFI